MDAGSVLDAVGLVSVATVSEGIEVVAFGSTGGQPQLGDAEFMGGTVVSVTAVDDGSIEVEFDVVSVSLAGGDVGVRGVSVIEGRSLVGVGVDPVSVLTGSEIAGESEGASVMVVLALIWDGLAGQCSEGDAGG
jgi:hypothetical protein